MAQQEPASKPTMTGKREIPDKLYFRIGEVARLCDVPAYVLRFWETEFPQLRPNKGGTGQRLYRRRDVEMALRIKTLLYDEGYTIPGARQAFKSEQKQKDPVLALGIEAAPASSDKGGGAGKADPTRLRRLRKEMQELLTLVSKPVVRPVLRPSEAPRLHGAPVQSIRETWSPRAAAESSEAAIERLFEEPLMFPD
ncbi:MAG TPA: MerR family transcriptional regulator [Granulicella sp.]|jgi:DNA-binding transcriptional MerR regulator|nr:MerR family transcriptional regulator [Granulicella sp.]